MPQRGLTSLRVRLVLSAFAFSITGILFVGFITYNSSANLNSSDLRHMFATVANPVLTNHSGDDVDGREWDAWLANQKLLVASEFSAILFDQNESIVAVADGDKSEAIVEYFQNRAEALPALGADPAPLEIHGNELLWDRYEITNSNYSLAVFYNLPTDRFSRIFRQLVLPTSIAGGIALWASLWAAVILSNLLATTRQKEFDAAQNELERRVVERTSQLEHEIGERTRAEDNLRKSRDELELRVAERTRALNESEARLNRAAKLAKVGHWVWDLVENRTVFCSELNAEIYGLTVEEYNRLSISSDGLRNSVHPHDRDAYFETIRKANNAKSGYECQMRVLGSNDKIVHVKEIGEPVFDGQGNHIQTVGVTMDISEVSQAEHALKVSDKRFQDLIEGSVQGVMIHDGTKIHFANKSYASVFGYDEVSEFLNLGSPRSHVAPHEIDRLKSYSENRLKGLEVPDTYEFEGVRKDGTPVWLENRVQMITWDEKPAVQLTIMDVTKRKKLDRLKDEFVSTVSHELRTPLTSAKGSLGLLVNNLQEELSDGAHSLVKIAYRNTNRVIELVNDILDMEKIASGEIEYDFQPYNLSDLVEAAIDDYRGLVVEYGDREFISDLNREVIVNGDVNRLTQVVANLLSNAIKFSAAGTEIRIAVSRKGDNARVAVSDCGEGIAAEHRDYVFERFTQIDGSDKRQTGGSGLGLNISRAIIEQHGGNISFESVQGEGSTFFFDIPAIDPRAQDRDFENQS